MLKPNELADADDLLARLKYISQNSTKSVLLITGSALSMPDSQVSPGVPSSQGVLSLISNELGETQSPYSRDIGGQYQQSFKRLLSRSGHDGARAVIQRATLSCRINPSEINSAPLSDDECNQLDENHEGWYIPKPHRDLAELLSLPKSPFKKLILTSNFDPLHEVSLASSDQRFFSTILDQDGIPTQSWGLGFHLIHFHGYWYGSDTLHTSRQLEMERPKLKSSLKHYLRDTTILVIGYGGWNDIVSNTLAETIADPSQQAEMLWCFFDKDKEKICEENEHLFSKFSAAINQGRAVFYCNVDCQSLFSDVAEYLREPANSTTAHDEATESDDRAKLYSQDHPPKIDAWVGRVEELDLIRRSTAKMLIITGVGGQGKSFLAAKHFQSEQNSQNAAFTQFAWFDLREEGDSLATKLIGALTELSFLTSEELSQSPPSDLARLFVAALARSSGLIVLDNVDHYIDLENGQPIGLLTDVVEQFRESESASRLVLTCRPQVNIGSIGVDYVHLDKGLNIDEAVELFRTRENHIATLPEIEISHELTRGHPLWLNFLAIQSAQNHEYLQSFITQFDHDAEVVSEDMFELISHQLNTNQRDLLYAIAALPKAVPESTLFELTSQKLKYNRFSKALKKLDRLSFLVTRQTADDRLIDLHPIVRHQARNQYRDHPPVLVAFRSGAQGFKWPLLRPFAQHSQRASAR